MSRRAIVMFTVVVAGVASFVTLRSAGSRAEREVAGRAAPAARARPALIAAPGRVEARSEEIDVGPELPGRLREVLVDEGDVVARGQVLARLENADYVARVASADARLAVARAELDRLVNGARPEERREAGAAAVQAEAVLRNAEADLERRRALYADGVISREELDRAEREVRVAHARHRELTERSMVVSAEARVDERARAEAAVRLAAAQLSEARAYLDKTAVRSPIDGVVLRQHRRSGESVSLDSPSPAIVTVADSRILRVRVEVDERDVARLAVGQRAWVRADAYGDRRFEGRVERIGEVLGRKRVRTEEPAERVDTKVLETLVQLDPGARLPLGLRVDAFIEPAATR